MAIFSNFCEAVSDYEETVYSNIENSQPNSENRYSHPRELNSQLSFAQLPSVTQDFDDGDVMYKLGYRAKSVLKCSTLHLGKDCSICFAAEEKASIILPCMHKFHIRCIFQWFERSVKCPSCNLDVVDALNYTLDVCPDSSY